jgi:hypothetical protein
MYIHTFTKLTEVVFNTIDGICICAGYAYVKTNCIHDLQKCIRCKFKKLYFN